MFESSRLWHKKCTSQECTRGGLHEMPSTQPSEVHNVLVCEVSTQACPTRVKSLLWDSHTVASAQPRPYYPPIRARQCHIACWAIFGNFLCFLSILLIFYWQKIINCTILPLFQDMRRSYKFINQGFELVSVSGKCFI